MKYKDDFSYPKVGEKFVLKDTNPFDTEFIYIIDDIRTNNVGMKWYKMVCPLNDDKITIDRVTLITSYLKVIEED